MEPRLPDRHERGNRITDYRQACDAVPRPRQTDQFERQCWNVAPRNHAGQGTARQNRCGKRLVAAVPSPQPGDAALRPDVRLGTFQEIGVLRGHAGQSKRGDAASSSRYSIARSVSPHPPSSFCWRQASADCENQFAKVTLENLVGVEEILRLAARAILGCRTAPQSPVH